MKKLTYENANLKDTVAALGKFEGLHRGHMLLIDRVLELAHETGRQSVVLSIDVPNTARIYTIPERDALLDRLGIDSNVTCEFTEAFAAMEPEVFVREILVARLDVKYVVVGKDFRFGKDRKGDVALLTALGNTYGYTVISFDKVTEGGEVISSSRIRGLLETGDAESVQLMMGRPYSMSGIVTTGKKLGRTIGYPTANLLPEADKFLIENGVYETRVHVDGEVYRGVTNVGENPTVDTDHRVKVETHILFFEKNIYGSRIKLDFLRQIRKEIKFNDIQALKNQIKSDTIEVAHQ